MKQKSLISLFESPDMALPCRIQDTGQAFLHHFSHRMEQYQQLLQSVSEDEFEAQAKTLVLKNSKYLITGLKEVFNIYLNGLPAQSYKAFTNLIQKTKLADTLNNQRKLVLPGSSFFFRIRKENEPIALKRRHKNNGIENILQPKDMFHMPFQLRKHIGTARFSIPGFPCIYLSDTLPTSWSECVQNTKDPFHAIAFTNHRPLYMIDLVPLGHQPTYASANAHKPSASYSKNLQQLDWIAYASVFPIIFACHAKVLYNTTDKVHFKAEYILPQLLLQWYREKGGMLLDGLRYLSCTAADRFPNEQFNKYNYILPATTIQEEGYCPELLYNFSATPVYSHLHHTGSAMDVQLLTQIQNHLLRQPRKPLA
jgi:RES domain